MNAKKYLIVLSVLLFAAAGFVYAQACPANQFCNPISAKSFADLFAKLVSIAGTVLFALGGIMIPVAGVLYLLSFGNANLMSRAKSALIYAFAGLLLGGLASGIAAMINNIFS